MSVATEPADYGNRNTGAPPLCGSGCGGTVIKGYDGLGSGWSHFNDDDDRRDLDVANGTRECARWRDLIAELDRAEAGSVTT
jgi:hypothetical protein